MDINVNVKIGLSDDMREFARALSELIFDRSEASEASETSEVSEVSEVVEEPLQPAKAKKARKEETPAPSEEKPAKAKKARKEETPAPSEEKPAKAEEEPAEAAEGDSEEEALRTVSDNDLKQMMDICIGRLAGADWRDSKDQRVRAVRMGAPAVFKKISSWLGASKPTDLPEDKRAAFIEQLENVMVKTDAGKPEALPEVVWEPF